MNSDDMPSGKSTVTDDEIVKAICDHEHPVVTSGEIAEIFDHTRQWAHNRLNQLVDEGRVVKKGRTRSAVYWEDESETESGSSSAQA